MLSQRFSTNKEMVAQQKLEMRNKTLTSRLSGMERNKHYRLLSEERLKN
jgi:hypothetical protein